MFLAAVSTGPAIVVAVMVGYLLGSVPVALIVGRRHGIDLRSVGDRNPGYWNAKQQLGERASRTVFVGDATKGLAAGVIASTLVSGGRWWIAYLGVGAAMVGHAFPVFARLQGGRSVLTFVGGALVLSPRTAVAAIAVTIVVSLVTRRFAWGARAGVFGYPALQGLVDPRSRVAATGCLMTLIGVRFVMASVADRRRSAGRRADRTDPATS